MNRRRVFVALAVIGGILPWLVFWPHVRMHGISPAALLAAVWVNEASAAFAVDLLFSSLVFCVWVLLRAGQGGPRPAPFIALNLLLGLSCALPAYLAACERRPER